MLWVEGDTRAVTLFLEASFQARELVGALEILSSGNIRCKKAQDQFLLYVDPLHISEIPFHVSQVLHILSQPIGGNLLHVEGTLDLFHASLHDEPLELLVVFHVEFLAPGCHLVERGLGDIEISVVYESRASSCRKA